VLGLRVDADPAAQPTRLVGDQGQHLVEGRHVVAPVVPGVARPERGQPLDGAQRLELGEGEVLTEPTGDLPTVHHLGGQPAGELPTRGDVGGRADLVLVAGDQHPVTRRHQIRLDVVGAHRDGQPVRRERVLGPIAGGPAVADHQWRLERLWHDSSTARPDVAAAEPT
jgi:hypothetical protein